LTIGIGENTIQPLQAQVPEPVAEGCGGLLESAGCLGQAGVPGRHQHQPDRCGDAGLLQAPANVDRLAAQACRKAANSTLRWPDAVCTTQELVWRITASTLASLWAGSSRQPSRRSSRVRIVAASRYL
jgi:hypothetical protein